MPAQLTLASRDSLMKRISDFGFRISGDSVDVARAGGWLKAPEIRNPKSEILR